MQRLPVHSGKSCIARGNGGIADVVVNFACFVNGITQFLQRTGDQLRLEGFFRDSALDWLYSDAFAWQIGSESAGGDKGGKRCGNNDVLSHRCSLIIGGTYRPGKQCATGQRVNYFVNGRVISPTGPVVYQRRLPRLRASRPTACVRRSRMMARITIPTPPTVASPISRRPIPRRTI